MEAVEELSHLLRPAGGGIYVVSTGRAEQQAVQRRLYRAGSDDEVERRFQEALRRIETGESGANEKTVAGLIRALPVLLDAPEVLSLAGGQVGHGWHRLQSPGGGRWWVKPATGESMPEARAVARALVAR